MDEAILRSIRARRSGSVFSAKQFEGVGKAAAVRQALNRLAKAGKIRRIRQGLYDLPRTHPIIGQTAPDPMAAVRALMAGSQAQWQVSDAYIANQLGILEQVPARIVILTDGGPHRSTRSGPANPAGLVIQALRHMRAEGMDEARLSELRSLLDKSTRDELANLTPILAAWMQPLMKRLTQEEKA